jgi:hypothetical protein
MRLLFLLALCGCASIPGSPDLDLCIIDAPRYQLQCQGTHDPDRKVDLDFEDADKYVCVSPEHWGEILDYIGSMKDELEDCGILR